ncbi:hypothetical protein [Niallia sp. 03133]|uniref:hypothetical protein n=1 Tax=Niallia sp. 03133 TaxID=3458060 RepID=UPI004044E466
MEPFQKKYVLLIFIMIIGGALLLFYIISLKAQLQEVKSNQSRYEKEIKRLKNVHGSEAALLNETFLDKFFTYEHTEDRYKNVETLMTDQGFASTHPSGAEIPSTKESVESSLSGLKAYEYKASKMETAYINEFELTTEYNGVSDTVTTLVKTDLLYVKNKGWKVNDIEYIGELTGN